MTARIVASLACVLIFCDVVRGNCLTSSPAWQNTALFLPQSGQFAVEYDATPNNANMDAITALSLGAGSTFDVLADFTMGGSGEGTLSILGGASVTVALVGGAYTQALTGHLGIELTPTSGVSLQVYGDANLAGSLSVTMADGFDPAAGESFDIIDAFAISMPVSSQIIV